MNFDLKEREIFKKNFFRVQDELINMFILKNKILKYIKFIDLEGWFREPEKFSNKPSDYFNEFYDLRILSIELDDYKIKDKFKIIIETEDNKFEFSILKELETGFTIMDNIYEKEFDLYLNSKKKFIFDFLKENFLKEAKTKINTKKYLLGFLEEAKSKERCVIYPDLGDNHTAKKRINLLESEILKIINIDYI